MWIIVETIEDGEVNVCTVPQNWEKGGILFWPPGRKAASMCKDEHSVPDQQTWSKQSCTVKRKNFKTYSAALQAEKFLSNFIDTEEEQNYVASQKEKKGKTIQRDDFNFMIRKSHVSSNSEVDSHTVKDAELRTTRRENLNETINCSLKETPKIISEIEVNDFVINNDVISFPATGLFDNTEIKDKLTIIEDTVKNIEREQQFMKKDIAKIFILFDKLTSMLSENTRRQPSTVEIENENGELVADIKNMEVISSIDDMNKVETKLQDKKFFTAFIEVFSEIGGRTGKKAANKIAYTVLDRIMDRQLLTQCSWTGSSKQKNCTKICFRKYTNLIAALYNVIHLADSNFSENDNCNFLKTVLRNSTIRHQRQSGNTTKSTVEGKETTLVNQTNTEEEI